MLNVWNWFTTIYMICWFVFGTGFFIYWAYKILKKKEYTPEDLESDRQFQRHCIPQHGDYQITLEYKHGEGTVSFSPMVTYNSLAEARLGGEEHLKKENNPVLTDGKVKITKFGPCPHCGQGHHEDVTNSLGSIEFNPETGAIKVTDRDGKVATSWEPEDRGGESCTAPNKSTE